MGWRFRKSVKVAPGTRINVSKSGVSMTNRVGKTGIYHRAQLLGGNKKRDASTPSGEKKKIGCLPIAIVVLLFFGMLGSCTGTTSHDKAMPVQNVAETSAPTPTLAPTARPTPTPKPTPDPTPLESLTPEEAYAQTMERLARLGGKTVEEYQQEMYGKEEVFSLNKKTKIYHDPSCAALKNADRVNIETFVGTRLELAEAGYTPCGRCHP